MEETIPSPLHRHCTGCRDLAWEYGTGASTTPVYNYTRYSVFVQITSKCRFGPEIIRRISVLLWCQIKPNKNNNIWDWWERHVQFDQWQLGLKCRAAQFPHTWSRGQSSISCCILIVKIAIRTGHCAAAGAIHNINSASIMSWIWPEHYYGFRATGNVSVIVWVSVKMNRYQDNLYLINSSPNFSVKHLHFTVSWR